MRGECIGTYFRGKRITDMNDQEIPTEGFKLDDKVAIVSGAGTHGGRGIGNGAATAILFAKHGANVVLIDQNLDWAKKTKEIIQSEGGTAIAVEANVTDPNECEAVVGQTIAEFGRVDILHNNVGGGPRDNVVEADDQTWKESIELNVLSVVYMSRQTIPYMRDADGGSITMTSSVQARRPGYDYVPYTMTKTALKGLTRGIAIDHGEENIRANCIMPGPIWTPKVASTRGDEQRKQRRDSVPLPREGQPWDVGWAAVFLASDEASWITGQTLPVEGGALLTRAGDRPGMF